MPDDATKYDGTTEWATETCEDQVCDGMRFSHLSCGCAVATS